MAEKTSRQIILASRPHGPHPRHWLTLAEHHGEARQAGGG